MDHVVRSVDGTQISFPVYSEEEAKEKGIEYVEWRDSHPGDWAVSDDGFVALCLNRKEYSKKGSNRKVECVFLVHGTMWLSSKQEFSYLQRKRTNTFTRTSAMSWQETEAKRQRTLRVVRAYIDMFLAYKKIDWAALGQIYRPDQADPGASVKRLFREKKITELIVQGITDALEQKGITKAEVVDMFNRAYSLAIEQDDTGPMIRVAENFAKMLDMYNPNSGGRDPNDITPRSGEIIDGIFSDIERLEGGSG